MTRPRGRESIYCNKTKRQTLESRMRSPRKRRDEKRVGVGGAEREWEKESYEARGKVLMEASCACA